MYRLIRFIQTVEDCLDLPCPEITSSVCGTVLVLKYTLDTGESYLVNFDTRSPCIILTGKNLKCWSEDIDELFKVFVGVLSG